MNRLYKSAQVVFGRSIVRQLLVLLQFYVIACLGATIIRAVIMIVIVDHFHHVSFLIVVL